MAKINNTSVYPTVTPASDDLIILSDASDSDKTKTAKVSDFQSFFGTKTLSVTLSSAQILNANTAPVVLLTAGTNEYIQIICAMQKYTHGSTQYTATGNYVLTIDGNQSPSIVNLKDIDAMAADTVSLAGLSLGAFDFPTATGGSNITFQVTGATNPTNGDGTLTLNILYRIVTL